MGNNIWHHSRGLRQCTQLRKLVVYRHVVAQITYFYSISENAANPIPAQSGCGHPHRCRPLSAPQAGSRHAICDLLSSTAFAPATTKHQQGHVGVSIRTKAVLCLVPWRSAVSCYKGGPWQFCAIWTLKRQWPYLTLAIYDENCWKKISFLLWMTLHQRSI